MNSVSLTKHLQLDASVHQRLCIPNERFQAFVRGCNALVRVHSNRKWRN